MKTLREYINIVNEAELTDWKTVITNEINARGLPKRVCTLTHTSYGWAWGMPEKFNYKYRKNLLDVVLLDVSGRNVLVASPDPENDGNLPSPLDIYDFGGDGTPSYTNAKEVLSCIKLFCTGRHPDQVYVDYENGKENYTYEFEFGNETIDENSPEYESVIKDLNNYIITKQNGDDTGWEFSTICNFFRSVVNDQTEYYDVGNHNDCEVQWPNLTIKISGPNPRISKIEGNLTPNKA